MVALPSRRGLARDERAVRLKPLTRVEDEVGFLMVHIETTEYVGGQNAVLRA